MASRIYDTANAVASSSSAQVKVKKAHKHKRKHSKHKEEKHHRKHKEAEGKTGPFEHRRSRLRLSVPPKFAGEYLHGVREILDGMLMRYVAQMGGVLLAHWDHELIDETVKIINECPYGICEVEFYSILWAPKVKQRLYGTHSLSSPSHISLLFAKTFNISIPLQHIPTDQYEFEHTQVDDDDNEESDSDSDGGEEHGNGSGSGVQEVGRWRRKDGGGLVGEGKGVKFTVIGMQVTNSMLSITGSLLADPMNPPPPPTATTSATARRSPSPEDNALEPHYKKGQAKLKIAKKDVISTKTPILPSDFDSAFAPGVAGHTATATATAVVDERFLSARELKQRRKDEEKKKREERKARKEERVLEAVRVVGGAGAVGEKRKAEGGVEEGEGKKKKK